MDNKQLCINGFKHFSECARKTEKEYGLENISNAMMLIGENGECMYISPESISQEYRSTFIEQLPDFYEKLGKVVGICAGQKALCFVNVPSPFEGKEVFEEYMFYSIVNVILDDNGCQERTLVICDDGSFLHSDKIAFQEPINECKTQVKSIADCVIGFNKAWKCVKGTPLG
ncbi:MAG: hypothetical protein IJI14_10455 [Anaerolineaceae bacterium]|nr:hypothetical protein [Anaerolineaceae bacterium]